MTINPTPKRYLSLFFPWFAADIAVRRSRRALAPHHSGRTQACAQPREPVLLTAAYAGRETVADCCAQAAKRGVRIGMDVANARALLPTNVLVMPHDAASLGRSLHALAEKCNRFAPIVSVHDERSLLLDITGTHLLHKGERRLLMSVHAFARRLELCLRTATADSALGARAIAEFSGFRSIITPRESLPQSLAPLPVHALQLEPAVIQLLQQIGVQTIGQLLALPRSALPARYGCALPLRIEQAMGNAPHVMIAIRPRPPLRIQQVFDGATTHYQSIVACVQALLLQLSTQLAANGRGARTLLVELQCCKPAAPVSLVIALSAPSRETRHLWSLIEPRLATCNFGEGIEAIACCATSTAIVPLTQQLLNGNRSIPATQSHTISQLIDTLANRLGTTMVTGRASVESHLPERASRAINAGALVQRRTRPASQRVCDAPRPSHLFVTPEPAFMSLPTPGSPAHTFLWRSICWDICSCMGPERIGGEWWRQRPLPPDNEICREYFRICIANNHDPPRWIWAYRSTAPPTAWFVHGEWT